MRLGHTRIAQEGNSRIIEEMVFIQAGTEGIEKFDVRCVPLDGHQGLWFHLMVKNFLGNLGDLKLGTNPLHLPLRETVQIVSQEFKEFR